MKIYSMTLYPTYHDYDLALPNKLVIILCQYWSLQFNFLHAYFYVALFRFKLQDIGNTFCKCILNQTKN